MQIDIQAIRLYLDDLRAMPGLSTAQAFALIEEFLKHFEDICNKLEVDDDMENKKPLR